MDRREALKRIGIGGVAAVGGSAIRSTPAFAYTSPTMLTSPVVTVAIGPVWSYGLQVTITAGTASCPASAGAATLVEISATPTRVTCQSVPIAAPLYDCGFWMDEWKNQQLTQVIPPDVATVYFAVPLTVSSTTGLLVFDLAKGTIPNYVGNTVLQFDHGDEFSVSISTVFRCTYPDLTTSDTTDTVLLNYRYGAAGWALVG